MKSEQGSWELGDPQHEVKEGPRAFAGVQELLGKTPSTQFCFRPPTAGGRALPAPWGHGRARSPQTAPNEKFEVGLIDKGRQTKIEPTKGQK